ncbi:hypothetical protein EPUL_003608 [Erysiphe pulchra]|uniref:Uncharacterized protein n=1 Tax=Erysiphe pulchra TaxID=225359 RepID=A0A2S4PQP2_9PEZI|nr:hypothetical protein EPUL_003608 [Erysiphe pulchra]
MEPFATIVKSVFHFYVTEISRERFAWIQRGGVKLQLQTKKLTHQKSESINDVISKFEKLRGSWNIEKDKAFDQDTAKFFSQLTDLLSDEDQAVFEEYDCAVKVWNHLKQTYTKTINDINYMTNIQSFPDQFNRRLAAADEGLKNIYLDKALFHILYKSLPSKYTAILDGFPTNPTIPTKERLQTLQEKEEDSRFFEKAHPSLNRSYSKNFHRNSEISLIDAPKIPRKILCYRCCGENHISREYPYAEEIKAYSAALRKKDEKNNQKQRNFKQTDKLN